MPRRFGRGLTSGVSGERSAAERVHCTPGLGGGRCGAKRLDTGGAGARLVGANDTKEGLDVVLGGRKQEEACPRNRGLDDLTTVFPIPNVLEPAGRKELGDRGDCPSHFLGWCEEAAGSPEKAERRVWKLEIAEEDIDTAACALIDGSCGRCNGAG